MKLKSLESKALSKHEVVLLYLQGHQLGRANCYQIG